MIQFCFNLQVCILLGVACVAVTVMGQYGHHGYDGHGHYDYYVSSHNISVRSHTIWFPWSPHFEQILSKRMCARELYVTPLLQFSWCASHLREREVKIIYLVVVPSAHTAVRARIDIWDYERLGREIFLGKNIHTGLLSSCNPVGESDFSPPTH